MNSQNKQYILAIDIGTTSIRTLAFDIKTQTFSNIYQKKVTQIYPEPHFVEQDANEIMSIINSCLKETIKSIPEEKIIGLGLTNQRETVVAWDSVTGTPLYNAIVWQCRRTHEVCQKLRNNKKINNFIQQKTGLFPDSYFSATKIKWLLDNVPQVQKALNDNRLHIGTLDSFVIFNLTKGEKFVTDHSNASRTLLYNIATTDWDKELLKFFDIPANILPEIINCDQPITNITIDNKTIPLGGIIGDQQASLLGQCCTSPGDTKITYGTGAFMLSNIGNKPAISKNLITTIAWKTKEGTSYAFEGNMYSAGACINWLTDRLRLIDKPQDTEKLAKSVEDSGGVIFVPALSGLGAPFWKSNAKATFHGITLATTDAHLVRAVLRGITYNTRAVFDEMKKYINFKNSNIRLDGGMTKNEMFIQFVSDTLHTPVTISQESESTSLGACLMCGLAFGVYKDLDSLLSTYRSSKTFTPAPYDNLQEQHYTDWLKYVEEL